ncbi:ABC transporter substrate-binding protein [Ramlibacter sp. G-1-2-2]|uniref:ABC transporter substrate-binding protein n=1 Tax=Ramlibacter agri TaxID=2728837 RepID=A0A848H4G1_9BURK|nr:tripartite tricarboxylate transporter substrate-binding protein [Ramlibacter agri]NML45876.1 ABC transporter substrate-binding protein [Ramlibacter agri]
MPSRRIVLAHLAAAGCAMPSFAQDDKSPVKLLVGASAGTDFTARVIAEKLKDSLGRPVVVISKLGAGQQVALGELKRSAPDGRTLMLVTSAPFSIYPHIYQKLDYEPLKDFTPIAGVSSFDVGIATGPATAARDMPQLVQWIRSNPKLAIYGSAPGTGSLSHFVGISLGLAIGQALTHVPYKESPVGLVDVSTGRLPMMMTGLSGMIELHKAGKLRVIASSGSQRSPLLPDVPTMTEAGVKVNTTSTVGIFGPAGMPPEVVAPLTKAIIAIASTPEYRDKLAIYNVFPKPATPQELSAVLGDEYKQFAALVKASGYTPE